MDFMGGWHPAGPVFAGKCGKPLAKCGYSPVSEAPFHPPFMFIARAGK